MKTGLVEGDRAWEFRASDKAWEDCVGEGGGMLVQERMTRNPVTVQPGDSVALAAAKMKARNFRRLPVVDEGRLVGIISQYDLKDYCGRFDTTLVKAAMTPDPVTVSPAATLEHAMSRLLKHKIGALPVVDAGELVGIITAADLWIAEPRALPEWIPRSSR